MSMLLSTVYERWIESTLVTGMDSRGKSTVIGMKHESNPEWRGIKPSDLLLQAAASCSAYDIVKILKKQWESVEDLENVCTGEPIGDPPYTFVGLRMKYL